MVLSVTEEKLQNGDYLLKVEITEELRNKLEETLGENYEEILQESFPLFVEEEYKKISAMSPEELEKYKEQLAELTLLPEKEI